MVYDENTNEFVECYGITVYSKTMGKYELNDYDESEGKWTPFETKVKAFADARLHLLSDDVQKHAMIQIGDGIILRTDDIAGIEVVKI